MDMYKFGNYICKLREQQNMTQADLAKALDVSDKQFQSGKTDRHFPEWKPSKSWRIV